MAVLPFVPRDYSDATEHRRKLADGVLASFQSISERMRYQGPWQSGTRYEANDVVTRDGVTFIALTSTTQMPTFLYEGAAAWAIPDSPTWTARTATGIHYSGIQYFTASSITLIDGVRFWVPDASANLQYSAWILDITDPNNEIVVWAAAIPNTLGWQEVTAGQFLLYPGTVIRIFLLVINTTQSTSWQHQWTFAGLIGEGSINAGEWRVSQDLQSLHIHQTDQGSTDRSADLALLKQGSTLRTTEAAVSTRWWEWGIFNNIVNGQVVELGVFLNSNGQPVRNGQLTDVLANIASQQDTVPYVELTNHWNNAEPPDMTVQGFQTEVYPPTVFDANAYGVDIQTTRLVISSDWDIIGRIL